MPTAPRTASERLFSQRILTEPFTSHTASSRALSGTHWFHSSTGPFHVGNLFQNLCKLVPFARKFLVWTVNFRKKEISNFFLQFRTCSILLKKFHWWGTVIGLSASVYKHPVWSKVQMICIWSSWCHYHPTHYLFALLTFRMVLRFWYWLTQIVLETRPLNGCSSSGSSKLNIAKT